MKLIVYKGFDCDFLRQVPGRQLVWGNLEDKKNVLMYTSKFRRNLQQGLLDLEETDGEAWLTYEEFSLIHKSVGDACVDAGLFVEIVCNNLYPDAYPLEFDITPELYDEIEMQFGEERPEVSSACKAYLDIYNHITKAGETFYGTFNNYEFEIEEEGVGSWHKRDYYHERENIEA